MPTTKVRKATPMKNKTALWRRMATNGNGRLINPSMAGDNQKYPSEFSINLMKHAGIDTLVYDKLMQDAIDYRTAQLQAEIKSEELQSGADNDIMVQDVEIIEQRTH